MPTLVPEPSKSADTVLSVRGLSSGYGRIGILHKVDFEVRRGEIVAVIGPNGAGKTTMLSSISGLVGDVTAGSVTLMGTDVTRHKPRSIVRKGLLHIVEGHRVFGNLTVEDNLSLAGFGIDKTARQEAADRAWEAFPEIAEKRHEKAGRLSGGQQQMLVIAQGLVRRPDVLMLDEPSAGLSPLLVDRVLEVADELRRQGMGIVIVEQSVEKVLAVSDRAYVLSQGRISFEGPVSELASGEVLHRAYLGETHDN